MFWFAIALKWLVIALWMAMGGVLVVAGNGIEIPLLTLPDIRGGYGVYAGAAILIAGMALASSLPIKNIQRTQRTVHRPFN